MKLTKEKLKNILEGLRDYLYNELQDAADYEGFGERVFNEAYDDAIMQAITDAEDNGDFEEE